MAMNSKKGIFRHVNYKAKTAWKNVEIPQSLTEDNLDLFHGLCGDVQELTDYEIISEDYVSKDVSSTRGRKRKKDSDESQSLLSSVSKKKRKGDCSLPVSVKLETSSKNNETKVLSTSCESDFVTHDSDDISASGVKILSDGSKTTGIENVGKKKGKRKKKQKLDQHDPEHGKKKFSKDKLDKSHLTSAAQTTNDIDMSQWKNLFVPEELMCSLQEQGFVNPTEIQILALPSAIRDKKDIIGAAETGSGKTLAFGIPIVAQILSSHGERKEENQTVVESDEENSDDSPEEQLAESANTFQPKKSSSQCGPKALILEPTRELAVQVHKHLKRLASHTQIKFATVIGGMSIDKQIRMLKQAPEVVIATPGRLWQLIEEGEQHLSRVDCVHGLVVDEADRMIEKGHFEELTKILHYINASQRRVKKRQTYIMSATLSMEVPVAHGFNKKKFKKKKSPIESKLKNLTEICIGTKPKIIDLTTKDIVAHTLTEWRINCTILEKDFYLYYFLCEHPGRTLVFVNSKDCLRRLAALFTILECSPLPLHADMHQTQRLKNLDRFTENSNALLIASDVAARGLDIPKIDHVIHYQVPRTIENYVHRSGRTARASSVGLSVMLVGATDARDYQKIVHHIKNGKEVPIMPIDIDLLPAVKMRVELARSIDEKQHRSKKKKSHNNFFQKAAQDMDMILDDPQLHLDMGSAVEQSEEKQNLQAMKSQLLAMLKRQLAPLHMSKYPTKSGSVVSKKTINLYNV